MKQHYPKEYFSALLTSVLGNQTKVAEYIAEAASRGIRVLPPDINESRVTFAVSGKDIRFGLLAIRNVGRQFLEQILEERGQRPFRSFEEFTERMASSDLNRRMVESLIKAGAFDRLGVYRSRLLASYERLIDQATEKGRNNLSGQLDMFSTMPAGETETSYFSYPQIPELGVREKLLMEREATGMFFSGQLLDGYSKHLAILSPQSISELVGEDADPQDKARADIAGIISSVSVKNTKNGERMAFFTVEDASGEMECVAFARQFAQASHLIRADAAAFVSGTVSLREDEPPKLLVNRIEELVENASFREDMARAEETPKKTATTAEPPKTAPVKAGKTIPRDAKRLFLRVQDTEGESYRKALNLAQIFEGSFPLAIYDAKTKQYDFSKGGVAVSPYLIEQFCLLLGEENVILK